MIKNLQALRAFAAISVIFVHLDKMLGRLNLSTFGGAGVDLFFVISGFVMVYTTQPKPPQAADFMLNRILRVVPIYWLATLSLFMIAVVKPSLLGATTTDMTSLLKSLFFIPYKKSSGLVEPVLFVGWSLNYEMFFYALFAIGLAMKRYLLGLGFVLAVLVALASVDAIWHPANVIAAFYANPVVIEFGLGMIIALLVPKASKTAPLALKLPMLVTLLAAPVLLFQNFIWPATPSIYLPGLLAAILVTGAVLLDRWGWSVSWKPIILAGDASYVLYLSHPYVTQTFQRLDLKFNPTLLLIACVSMAVIVAIILHKTVEKPLTTLLKGWMRGPRTTPLTLKPTST